MMLAWSITEVVRYSFYFLNVLGTVPFPLAWLRYSLFTVLYPMGICGEMFQTFVGMGAHWKLVAPFWYRMSVITVLIYVPGSPYLILNMWGNRKRSLKKLREANEDKPKKPEPEGVAWPLTDKGDRGTTDTNKAILAAAALAGPGGKEAADKISGERKWRFKYNEHLVEHVQQSLESEQACLSMARAGLVAAQDSFKLIRKGEQEISMKEAMEKYSDEVFETGELSGDAAMVAAPELALQYGGPTFGKPYYQYKHKRSNKISGEQLRAQLDAWVEYGTIEKDVADALKHLQANQDKWLDLSDTYFVLLGAASAMGPLEFLLELGATIVCVARPGALKGIFSKVKNSSGKILFPVRRGADWKALVRCNDFDALSKVSGCDLMKEPPEIASWLKTVGIGKKLSVGNYTYLDGALHVQIAVACDCIMDTLCQARGSDVALAFLPTPTDALVVTEESVAAANAAYKQAPLWMKAWEALGVLKPNRHSESGGFRIINSIEPMQGPSYILAKRMQHWRSLVARADGHTVSTNVSPTTATVSVMLKPSIVAAIGGMHIFKPVEVMFQELSMTVMAALLLHDLKNPDSAAQPSTKLAHPLCLLEKTSFNGGLWRCPYSMTTIAIPSAIYFFLCKFWPVVVAICLLLLSITRYAATGTVPGVLTAVLPSSPPWYITALAKSLDVPL
jgi:hypothetical protein